MEPGSPFLTSLEEIRSVTGVFLDTFESPWRVYFDVELTDGTRASYSTFMDPRTLYFFGAAG
jgi:hypothetical protein